MNKYEAEKQGFMDGAAAYVAKDSVPKLVASKRNAAYVKEYNEGAKDGYQTAQRKRITSPRALQGLNHSLREDAKQFTTAFIEARGGVGELAEEEKKALVALNESAYEDS